MIGAAGFGACAPRRRAWDFNAEASLLMLGRDRLSAQLPASRLAADRSWLTAD